MKITQKEMCSPNAMIENTDPEFEGSDASDSDSDESNSDSSDNASDDDTDSSGELEAEATEPSGSQEGEDGEEEDDEIVKAFKKAKETQRNHPPDITCEDFICDISFHPSSHQIAAGTIVGDVLLYKYSNESNELLETMEVHTKACRSVEFSTDGMSIITASKDMSWMVTDVATGKLKKLEEDAHENPIFSLKLIDENRVATVWDLRQRGALFGLKEMDDFVSDMVTNEAKRYLVCSCGDGTITSINLIDQRLHVQHDRKLVVSSNLGRLYVFNWGQFGYHSDEFPGPKVGINCMLPLTENIVVTGSEDGVIRATHLFPHRHIGIVGQHSFPVEQMDMSYDGELLASCSHDNTIKFWNIKYMEELHVSDRDKADNKKTLNHNLPSSKASNTADFFADMADT
ncbi:hypothetical protein B566_EDAN017681 [Ephemera danica]|nr:hypothetical protein B566_EDAN017681 [Ephemera danica]